MGTVILNPAAAAEVVCHDEQLRIWAEEIVGALSMGGYIREDASYDDAIDIQRIVMHEIKGIVEMAFDHPEARTIRRS
jgi:hypothetical protein